MRSKIYFTVETLNTFGISKLTRLFFKLVYTLNIILHSIKFCGSKWCKGSILEIILILGWIIFQRSRCSASLCISWPPRLTSLISAIMSGRTFKVPKMIIVEWYSIKLPTYLLTYTHLWNFCHDFCYNIKWWSEFNFFYTLLYYFSINFKSPI